MCKEPYYLMNFFSSKEDNRSQHIMCIEPYYLMYLFGSKKDNTSQHNANWEQISNCKNVALGNEFCYKNLI